MADFFQTILERPRKKKARIFNFAGLSVGPVASPLNFTFTRASVANIENGDNAYFGTQAAINEARIAKLGTRIGLRVEGATTNRISNPRRVSLWPGAASSGTSTEMAATATMTIAAPGLVTLNSHGLSTGDAIFFTTTGALPTGVTASTQYYVIVNNSNSFWLATSIANAQAGTKITTSGSQSGTHTAVYGQGADGNAYYIALHNINSGGYSKSFTNGAVFMLNTHRYTGSQMVKKNTLDPYQMNLADAAGHTAGGSVLPAGWSRMSLENTSNANGGAFLPADGRVGVIAAGARNYLSDFHQCEEGPVSSFIDGTRAAEVINLPAGNYAPTGRWPIEVPWVADISSTALDAWTVLGIRGNPCIWYLDISNYVEIIATGGSARKVKVVVAGQVEILPTALPTWSVGDLLQIRVTAGNGAPTGAYNLNGAGWVSLGAGSAQPALIFGGIAPQVFGKGTAQQLQGLIPSFIIYS